MNKYTLGIDIGTTSICALAYDAVTGSSLAAMNLPNTSSLKSADSFARMQDPEVILTTAYSLIDKITEKHGTPIAIGVTGQMHGIVYINKNGDAVSPLYTWQDGRAAQPMTCGETYLEHIHRVTGYKVHAGYGLATHFYNHVNGEIPPSAVTLCTIHDYLAMKLAGRTAPLIHASDAASLGLYDLARNCFDTAAVQALDMDTSMLPAVTADSLPIGYYSTGIPVYPAIGDNQASFLGTVGDKEGVLLINVGTGSQVSMIGKLCEASDGIECRPFVGGRHLLVGSALCGGRAYAVLERFFRDVANMCGANINSAYPFMDKLTEVGGDSSLTVSTLLDGTRENPDVRGSITGISTANLTPQAMMYGFMRGIAGELYELYKKMETPFTVCVGSGNGLRVNPALCRTVEEIFGAPLTLSSASEEAALGAARFAAMELDSAK